MSMFYRSTRDDNVKVTASQAILKGLAADGGLFVPESIPSLDKSLEELSKMNYKEVAYEVMKLMLDDFTSILKIPYNTLARSLHNMNSGIHFCHL